MKTLNFCQQPEYGLNLENTIAAGDREGAAALFRYWWAWKLVQELKPTTIFDLGCGCGYGTRILAEFTPAYSPYVFGIDNDQRAFDTAKGTYGSAKGLDFVKFNLEEHWKHPALFQRRQPVEMIVLFDVLEQLHHRDFFLDQLVEFMPRNGVLLLSANFPGRQQCHVAPEKHHFLYNRNVLASTLRRYFNRVEFLDTVLEASDHPALNTIQRPFRDQVNAFIKDTSVQPYTVGDDLVYCDTPIP